jgi:hypothetical protein
VVAPCPAWPEFKKTVFRFEARVDWKAYAIVTAYNPLGSKASPKENATQDSRLQEELESRGIRPVRVYGCSPDGKHQEPGWAAPLSREDAIVLGTEFRQDAIFYVTGKIVCLVSCPPNPRACESLGELGERLVH